MPKLTPHQQFKNEHRALLNRWLEESDIDDQEMAQIALTDVEEWMDEEVVGFDCDMDLEDDNEAYGLPLRAKVFFGSPRAWAGSLCAVR